MDWTFWLAVGLTIVLSIVLSRFSVQRSIRRNHRNASSKEERQYLEKIDQDIDKGKAAYHGFMPW
ncbi:hypothetical protein [Gleimia europaea]|uniref:hypothetical protein n=1 Tax=Gleimia europaea TaxID=66228 RepID=UPI00265B5843|nr:hypothetical protein [Gleimia europaea]